MKFFQRLGRSLMLPVAVLPVAAILSGIGYWVKNANGGADNIGSAFLSAAGGALLDNLALLFAVGVSIGMAKKSDGTSALAGLVSWLTVTTMLSPATMAALTGAAVEDVDTVEVLEAPTPGAFIRRRGADLRAGDVVVDAGERLGPFQVAAAVAAGIDEVTVARAPRVAVVSTGSELLAPGRGAVATLLGRF